MYVGLDIHKRFTQFALVDEKGEIVKEGKFVNEDQNFDAFLKILEEDAKIVMEACSVWEPIYDYIESQGFDVSLAHPLKTKAIADAKIKTDKIDARMLANLLRADLIHKSHVVSNEYRKLRFLTRHRAVLVRIRTRIKNYMHSILHREGIISEYTNILGKRSIKSLQEVPMTQEHKFAINNCIELAKTIDQLVETTEIYIENIAKDIPEIKILDTIPGVGIYAASMIYAEIGGIENFRNYRKLVSYAGLNPSVYQSGNTMRTGHITKQGSRWLRWILIQSVTHTIKKKNKIAEKYKQLKPAKKFGIARTAAARKLLVAIYIMLTQKLEFTQLRMNSV